MAHFVFKAKKSTGEIYSGEKDVENRYELYKLLRSNDEEVISYEEKKASKGLHMEINLSFLKKVKTIDKINFARNLGSMLEAGLALSRALSVLERQAKNKTFKAVIVDLMASVDKGMTFADSLSNHPKVFPQLFVSMVHAGEQSGTLAESLKIVALQMDRSYTLERRIRGALIYPAVILALMVVIGILMFIFVVPTLMKTFEELKVELPFATRVVLGISHGLQSYWYLVLIAVIVIVALYSWFIKQPKGKSIVHSLLLRIPIVGPLVQEVNTARTARTLSSLLTSGVNVVDSMTITAGVLQNVHFKEILQKAGEAIKKGDLMSKVFAESTKYYPTFMSEMVSVGEETGKIGDMLLGVAKYFEDDVEQKTKDMSTVIEPVLMIFIAAGVGFFAIAMLSPMYSLVDAI